MAREDFFNEPIIGGLPIMGKSTITADDCISSHGSDAAPKLSSKDTNPKEAVGGTKARWFTYIPLRVLVGVGAAMYEGARKYGRHNYRIAGVRISTYLDACVCGHLMPYMEGQDIDPDSGKHHIDKAIASLVVLRDALYSGMITDDRAPSVADWNGFIGKADEEWREITRKYPDAKPAYTIADTVEGK